MQKIEQKLSKREENLENKVELIEKREKELTQSEKEMHKKLSAVEEKEKSLGEIIQVEKKRLEEISGLSIEQAKELLLQTLEGELKKESALLIKQITENTKETAKRKARDIIVTVIQRLAADQVSEACVSTINLPSDDTKGRIIGREGRNIRAFESITGINLIIDDTPEAVVLSGFNPIRREAARLTLEKLISDGRIHPGRIEEVHNKTVKEMEEVIKEAGEQAAMDAGLHDLHPEIVKTMGRLKYRTSYGQNVLSHSIEVAQLSAMMAQELGADEKICRRGGFLHDLGKSIDFEMEGSHVQIGCDIARKYKENEKVIHCMEAHHGDVEINSVEAMIVQVCDALSASRPGARRESLESYIKRLTKLEEVAKSFPGVEKSFAIQAGREVRVVVEPDQIDDLEAIKLARDMAGKIEAELEYPGQIKVTVIRETRSVEYAK